VLAILDLCASHLAFDKKGKVVVLATEERSDEDGVEHGGTIKEASEQY
jgi:hypothetical protein